MQSFLQACHNWKAICVILFQAYCIFSPCMCPSGFSPRSPDFVQHVKYSFLCLTFFYLRPFKTFQTVLSERPCFLLLVICSKLQKSIGWWVCYPQCCICLSLPCGNALLEYLRYPSGCGKSVQWVMWKERSCFLGHKVFWYLSNCVA